MDRGNDAETEEKVGQHVQDLEEKLSVSKSGNQSPIEHRPRTNQQRRVVRYVYAAGEKSLERQARLEAIMSRNTPREHLPSGEKEHHVAVNSRHGGAVGVSDRGCRIMSQVKKQGGWRSPCRHGDGRKWQLQRRRGEAAKWQTHNNRKTPTVGDSTNTTVGTRLSPMKFGGLRAAVESQEPKGTGGAKRPWREWPKSASVKPSSVPGRRRGGGAARNAAGRRKPSW
ncbi:unnamed protein product, partial [Ectocarpus fasciculatus]